ncbi:MAG: radical SAM protein [Nitrosopumilus sp.]|nr:radical SAM protein [Nitrosopumilus sp.]CAI9832788.1 FO synthase subunit 2 protein [Nitrosopumilaceae archaeon]MDA7942238.1 radical SAM protein [Nitrosopumilus sp.]MDA7943676.1 radical SAM protein [Nitrosopumilus sp.]MDA7944390.1 radical SAM protein [Nitrosopumilus sp.]
MLEDLMAGPRGLERAAAGEDLSVADGAEILESAAVHQISAAADRVRRERAGDTVTFAASYYMNYTNVCAASCQMCAFYRKKGDKEAYALEPAEIAARAAAAEGMGATEVHIVGGFHPDLPLEYYEEMIRSIKSAHPALNVKALTAAEILFLSRITKNSVREVLARLKAAGLDSMPGGGAELFHPEVRPRIARGKCTGQEWLDVAREAHSMGIRGNVTMLYGHVERPEHVADHLARVRDLQRETGGFITMIPLKFSLENTELERDGVERECAASYDLKVVALSRLMLAGALDNISVYWVAYGRKLAQVALCGGGSDLVGTAFSEEVYRAAGRPTESSVDDLAAMAAEIGRPAAQRDTHFGILRRF